MSSPAAPGLRLVHCAAVVEAEVDGEVVALNAETAECYGLNGVGSRIWRLLAAPVTAAEICAALIAEYDVSTGECESAVQALLTDLLDEGLIEPAA
jgi:hypothetical protein